MLRASPAALARSPRKEVVYVQTIRSTLRCVKRWHPAGISASRPPSFSVSRIGSRRRQQVTGTSGSCPSEPLQACDFDHELQGLDLGVESYGNWMIGAGLWVRRKDRLKRIHSSVCCSG